MLYLILLFFMIVMVCGVISLVSNQSRKTKLEMEALEAAAAGKDESRGAGREAPGGQRVRGALARTQPV
ncbi:MAG: hypothetical protein U5R48_08610 [Gammaproteobacteria bacterium]|nr:hypothetical protein [Gammaproteobacteria bacterium]